MKGKIAKLTKIYYKKCKSFCDLFYKELLYKVQIMQKKKKNLNNNNLQKYYKNYTPV